MQDNNLSQFTILVCGPKKDLYNNYNVIYQDGDIHNFLNWADKLDGWKILLGKHCYIIQEKFSKYLEYLSNLPINVACVYTDVNHFLDWEFLYRQYNTVPVMNVPTAYRYQTGIEFKKDIQDLYMYFNYKRYQNSIIYHYPHAVFNIESYLLNPKELDIINAI